MKNRHDRKPRRKSRFEIETERRRREMLGTLAGRSHKVTHKWLRLFKPSTRRFLAKPTAVTGGAR